MGERRPDRHSRNRPVVDVPALLDALGIEYQDRGGALWALCPMHDEKEPSWAIVHEPGSKLNGAWYCYGSCGEGGYPAHLVSYVLGLSMRQAYEWLEGHLPEETPGRAIDEVELVVRRPGRSTLRMPGGVVFDNPLAKWPKVFRDYAERRRLEDVQIARWRIGYCVAGELEMRLVLPVHDQHGTLLSYAARTIVGDDTRYMTPDRAAGLMPGAVFGRRWWPATAAERARATVHVAEGAIDAIALERAGARYVGAVLGSDPTGSELSHLASFGRLVLVPDSDKAGDKLAKRFAGAVDGIVRRLGRVRLPDGADPAMMPPDELAALLQAEEAGATPGHDGRVDADAVPF